MIKKPERIKGKTYSLFGEADSTDGFFIFTNNELEKLLKKYKDENDLLGIIQSASRNEKIFREFANENDLLNRKELTFDKYIEGVREHLKEQSIFKFWDRDLKTKQWQYYLFMLEFTLTNRIFKNEFLHCNIKIALLPHCLRDLTKECKAEKNGFDYQCRHCSKECFINEASKILKENNVEPYLWMTADLKKMAKENFAEKKSLGVLGIACIPQLIRGMRMCENKNIPVVGLPLDANRCVRWMGDFYPNSINLFELKKLFSNSV